MRKSYIYLGVIFTLLLKSNLISGGSIKIDVDYARFKLDSGSTYLEIYYSIGQSGLTYLKTDNNVYSAEALVRFKIYDDDSLWVDQAWRVPSTVSDTSIIIDGKNIVDLIRYEIKPGNYSLVTNVQDLNDLTKRDSVEVSFDVSDFSNSKIVLSDIELASSIRKMEKDSNNVFYKNTLEVVPNPGSLFGKGVPMIYYYVEAYNLGSDQISDKYQTFCYISSSEQDTVNSKLTRQQIKKKVSNVGVEIGAINIALLNSGSYSFNFGISDMDGNQLDSRSKKFFVYNPEAPIEENRNVLVDSLLIIGPFAFMEESDLDKEADYVKYIMSKEGIGFYKQLKTAEAKRKFLFTFWQRRDPSPVTITNEARQEYLNKIAEADRRFKTIGREGWHTDMGRVYLLYGEPDNREWFRSTTATKPYELWTYYKIEGGVDFIFVDLSGFKQFRLIHSDKIGEVKNENWQSAIREHAR